MRRGASGAGSRRWWALVLWSGASALWSADICQAASGEGKPSGGFTREEVAEALKATDSQPRLSAFSLDTWAGLRFGEPGLDVGVGLALPLSSLRPCIQVAPDYMAVGLGLTMVPVIDITAGLNYGHDFRSHEERIGLYLSLFRF